MAKGKVEVTVGEQRPSELVARPPMASPSTEFDDDRRPERTSNHPIRPQHAEP